jgi:hypothetical protein
MRIAWMHPDCLSDAWFTPDDQAVFIFDDAYLAASGWGLKRILFVYETLLELPVEIHRGSTIPTLSALLADGRATGVVTVDTPDPWLRDRIGGLGRVTTVDIVPAPCFVELTGKTDLKRFSRYWAKAEGKLLA